MYACICLFQNTPSAAIATDANNSILIAAFKTYMLCESSTNRIISSKVSLGTMSFYSVESCRSTINNCTVCIQVETDEYGFALEPLVPGQLMAHHYINFKTMKDICMISGRAGLPDLLMAIARSEELSGIKLRRSEKKPLNAINKGSSSTADKTHAVRFYVPDPNKAQKAKERISTSAEKIFVMVRTVFQAYACCSLTYLAGYTQLTTMLLMLQGCDGRGYWLCSSASRVLPQRLTG